MPDNLQNSAKPDELKSYVARIEELDAQKQQLHMEYMKECSVLAGDKREIFKEAKETGVIVKSLRAVIKTRSLERKAEAARDNLEDDEIDDYDRIRHALGDLAETPLGRAALGDNEGAADVVGAVTDAAQQSPLN